MECTPIFFPSDNDWKSFCLNCLQSSNHNTPIHKVCNAQDQKHIQLCKLLPVTFYIANIRYRFFKCTICNQLPKHRTTIYCSGFNSLYVSCQTCTDTFDTIGVHPYTHYLNLQIIKSDNRCFFFMKTHVYTVISQKTNT